MKKLITLTLCAMMALSMVACGNEAPEEEAVPAIGGEANTQVANPFLTCDTLEACEEVAGFAISLPEGEARSEEHTSELQS